MRPCNQCRQPVENNLHLCNDCERYNEDHGLEAKPRVSMSPHDPATEKPVPFDQTINTIMFSFLVCSVVFFGLIGWQFAGLTGLLVGIAIGFLSGCIIPATLR